MDMCGKKICQSPWSRQDFLFPQINERHILNPVLSQETEDTCTKLGCHPVKVQEDGSKGREPGPTPQCPRAGLAAGMSQEPRAAGMGPAQGGDGAAGMGAAQGGDGQAGVRSGLVRVTKARHSPVPHSGRKLPPLLRPVALESGRDRAAKA